MTIDWKDIERNDTAYRYALARKRERDASEQEYDVSEAADIAAMKRAEKAVRDPWFTHGFEFSIDPSGRPCDPIRGTAKKISGDAINYGGDGVVVGFASKNGRTYVKFNQASLKKFIRELEGLVIK